MKRSNTNLKLLISMLYLTSLGAYAEQTYQLEIQPQALASALKRFAEQSGLQIVYYAKIAEGRTASGVVGTLSAKDALSRLLADTGLIFEKVDEKTLAIRSAKSALPVHGKKSTNEIDSVGIETLLLDAEEVRVAQSADMGKSASSKEKKSTDSKGSVEEMVVESQRERPAPFGTHNLDLTRTKDDALPFTTFTAEDIKLSGASNLEDFLRSRLVQNFTADIPAELGVGLSDTAQSSGGFESRISFRGWGANETVFLQNGRRMASQYLGTRGDSNSGTPNLRGIPLSAIERIEILSSAGSAIYGSGATGGIINIITRHDYRGGQLALSYDTPADTHAPTRGLDFSYGLPLQRGISLRFSGSYNENTPMKVGDRLEIAERWRQMVLLREPSLLLTRTSSTPYGATPNIRTTATNASANLFGPGTANFTTVPDGYTGGGLNTFQPGVYNLRTGEGASYGSFYAKDSWLGTATQNTTINLGLDKSLPKNWRWSLDYSYSRNNIDGLSSGAVTFEGSTQGRVRVPAAAPTNPFGQEVRVALIDPHLVRPELNSYSTNEAWEISSTLRGHVGQWHGFWDVSYSKNENAFYFDTFFEPTGGWSSALLDGRYNPFVDGRAAPFASAAFYDDYIKRYFDSASGSDRYQSTLKLSGPTLQLPAGFVQLTTGLEWVRSERNKSHYLTGYRDPYSGAPRTPVNMTSDISFNNVNPAFKFSSESYAAYAEANIPLISGTQNIPLMERFELFASGRIGREGYGGFRSDGRPVEATARPNVYVIGFRYSMLDGMIFRATQSVGFKPPYIGQITPDDPRPGTEIIVVNDRRRGDPNVNLNGTQVVSGGNPDLLPETTDSTNFGVVFSPVWAPGFRLSLDYIENVRDDAITGLSAQQLVDLEAEFPERVMRGAPDGNPSGIGSIIGLDYRNVNFRQISSRSLDFSIEQQFQNVLNGRLIWTLAAAKNLSYKVQTTNTAPSLESVRVIPTSTTFATQVAQQIAWNGNSQLRWEGKQWTLGWSSRYYDYMFVTLVERVLQGSDRAPRKFDHDIFIGYRNPAMSGARGLKNAVLSGTSVTFGMKNIFDRQPRFWASSYDRGIAPYDSIVGRSVWLQMRKDF